MASNVFTLGFPALDEYLGGIHRGESCIVFVSSYGAWRAWREEVSRRLSPSIRRVIVRPDDTAEIALPGAQYIDIVNAAARKRKKRLTGDMVRRALSGLRPGTVVFLGELSAFFPSSKHDDRSIELFGMLAELARKKNLVILAAAIRSSFSLPALAELKDLSDIAFDFHETDRDTLIVPLHLRRRYKPGQEGRTQFSWNALCALKPTALMQVGEASEPPEVRGEFLRDTIQPFILVDRAGAALDANGSALALLDVNRDELAAGKPLALISARDRFSLLRAYRTVMRRKHASCSLAYPSGKGTRHVEVEFVALRQGFVGLTLYDRTPLVELRERAGAGMREFQEFFRRSANPVLLLSERKVRSANDAFLRAFGFGSEQDVIARGIKGLFPGASTAIVHALLKGKGDEESPSEAVCDLARGDATTGRCALLPSAITLEGDLFTYLSIRDVTADSAMQKSLQEASERFRAIAEKSPLPLAMLAGGTFTYCNPAFVAFFGFAAPEEIIGQPHDLLERGEKTEWIAEQCTRRGFQKSGSVKHTFSAARPQTDSRDVEATITPVDGAGDRLLFSYRDVTAERQFADSSERLAGDLELLNAMTFALYTRSDLDKLLSSALHGIMEAFSWQCGGVYVLDDAGQEFTLRHQRSLPAKVADGLSRLPAGEGFAGFAAKTQEPFTTAIRKYPSYLPHRALFQASGLSAISLIPLMAKGKVVGLLFLATKEDAKAARFSGYAFGFLGKQLGSAIDAASTFGSLEKTAGEYAELLNASQDVFYRLSADGAFEFLSDNVEGLLGYLPREFRRNRSLWMSLVHPDDKRVILERTTNLERIRERSTITYRILPKGKAVHLTVRDTLILRRDERDTVTAMFGNVIDITADAREKRAVEQLLKEDERVLEALQDGVARCNPSGEIVFCNAAFERLIGKERAKVVGKAMTGVVPESARERIEQVLHAALAGEVVTSDDVQFLQKGGSGGRWFGLTMAPILSDQEVVEGIVALFTDVTAPKARETALRNSEQILRNVIDTMGDIFIITDLKGSVKQCNKAFQRILGYSYQEASNAEFPYPWLVDEEMPRYVLWVASLREKNWLHDFDMTWRAKEGRLIPVSLSTTLLRNSMGEPVAMLNIARDITERTRLMRDIERRNKELDDFTYVVSHDLKEPLISIEGFSRILHADYYDAIGTDGKEYLDSIVGATTRMKHLIDDLLMLSRVGRPVEGFRAVSLQHIVDEIGKDMLFTIRQKHVHLLVPEPLPQVLGNETHLTILFRNLIGNAIKFNTSPEPKIEIRFQNHENNSYLFSIADNGIGIEPEFFEKIFVIFQRLHRREEYEGTGAGLAIVKKIVEMHKGAIWVDSEPGKGSTFFITLPALQ